MNSIVNEPNPLSYKEYYNHQPAKYTFFSRTNRAFTKLRHILRYKTPFSLKGIEITHTIFSDHNGIKLEIKMRRIARKFPNIPKLKVKPLNKALVI